ncbi:ALH_1b_G0031400.mRNA.1.CDS.1 [Saccharomyces cerevisiae]|nr:ALH_1b_G0031400.mRNA.1.CDS.1 [Saccharomyces cerevisiae]CAI6756292.1 ALH_1b_G0031400.mRNA.1.CDS.1 [Saccharomyces cerevisiae]
MSWKKIIIAQLSTKSFRILPNIMSGVNNTSANDLSTTESNSNSAVGAPSVKTEHGDPKTPQP